jgi:hypothetical protein
MGRPMLNICGRRFGRLTIPLDAKPEVRKRCLYWPCICDCGTQTVVRGEFLRTGVTKSCGCLRASLARESLRGRRFGRLTIPQDATPEFRHHHPYWPCVCDCGAKRSVRDEVLLDGRTKSCGCLRADPSMRKAAKILLHDPLPPLHPGVPKVPGWSFRRAIKDSKWINTTYFSQLIFIVYYSNRTGSYNNLML